MESYTPFLFTKKISEIERMLKDIGYFFPRSKKKKYF